MNKKLRKILTLACSAVLLVCLSVGATVAYLTSSDSVQNTFTVGNVKIHLDETDVDLYGKKEGETRVKKNEYKLLPGHEYTKDPTVTVEEGSEESYVFMYVKASNVAALKQAFPGHEGEDGTFLLQDFVDWNTAWNFVEANANGEYIFKYNATVDARNAKVVMPALFTTITIPGDADNAAIAKLAGLTIDVKAFAIQADGMTDAIALAEAKAAFAK